MSNKKRNSLYIIVAVLLVATIGLSIAYAALSQSLSVTFSSVKQVGQTWDIKFNPTGSVTATSSGTDGSGNVKGKRVCGTATVNDTTITIGATTLSKPKDKCVWEFTIKNSGTIDAKLQSINSNNPTSSNTNESCTLSTSPANSIDCTNVKYTLCSDSSGTLLTTGGTLAKGGATKKVYVIAEYKDTNSIDNTVNIKSSTNNATEVTHSNAKFSLIYQQK